ncbi:hypothetical protein ACFSSC_03380 [Corynebacterium mendelii]|nr:hypothetical protein [Corynebacterium mendelii]
MLEKIMDDEDPVAAQVAKLKALAEKNNRGKPEDTDTAADDCQ